MSIVPGECAARNGNERHRLWLGTAAFFLKVPERTAQDVLAKFFDWGGKWIDTASNYPMTGHPSDFLRTVDFLGRNLAHHRNARVLVKVGAARNDGSAESLLSPSYLDTMYTMLREGLGPHLGGLAVHWDNRASRLRISETLAYLTGLLDDGMTIGFSGVEHLSLYREFNWPRGCTPIIQVRLSNGSNVGLNPAVLQIGGYFPKSITLGYGLYGGMRKGALSVSSRDSRQARENGGSRPGVHAAGRIRWARNLVRSGVIDGLIIGPTSVTQCQEVFSNWDRPL